MTIQQRVPVSRLHAVVQRRRQSGRGHRSLIPYQGSSRQAHMNGAVTTHRFGALRDRQSGPFQQPLGAEQAMLEDRVEVVGLREMIQACHPRAAPILARHRPSAGGRGARFPCFTRLVQAHRTAPAFGPRTATRRRSSRG